MTTPSSTDGGRRQGIVPAVRARLFGERDAVAEQLRDIERQGSGIAAAAHAASFLLIVLFSLGSLVAFAGGPLRQLQDDWARGRVNLPATISMGVSLLMVVAMDTAIVYAALRLRLLATRRAHAGERWLHVAVIAGVATMEAATYTYMSWLYDRPANPAAWAIIAMRGLAAPLLGVYLSLARPLPVGPGDVLYQVEFGAGAGLIRDATALAHDPEAPLGRKALLYAAAAPMAPGEAERLQCLIDVLANSDTGGYGREPESATRGIKSQRPASAANLHTRAEPRSREYPHQQQSQERRVPLRSRRRDGTDVSLDGGAAPLAMRSGGDVRSNVRTPPHAHIADAAVPLSHGDLPPRADTGMSQNLRLELRDLREEAARQILETVPTISVREFARRIEAATGNPISESTAQALLAKVRAELWRSAGFDSGLPPTGSEA